MLFRSASQQISKLTGISPPGRTSQPPSPAPSPPCVADDARYDALLANAGADYPLVRNTWPVPSQLISMSSFMSPFRCTLQSDVGAAKPLLCPRRPATVGHRRPATGPDIDADELLRQRTCRHRLALARDHPPRHSCRTWALQGAAQSHAQGGGSRRRARWKGRHQARRLRHMIATAADLVEAIPAPPRQPSSGAQQPDRA